MTIEGGTPDLTGYGYTNEEGQSASRQSSPLAVEELSREPQDYDE
jgi:hypothetical protein